MSILARAKFFSRLLLNKIAVTRSPLVVVMNITNRCNLRCGYCYGQYFNTRQKNFSTEELINLIDDLGRMGTASITLGGGEPLIRDDIGVIIRRIKSNRIECGFNTNGILIPKRLNDLRDADSVCVSLDGPREMNDKNRGAGSFDLIIKGIDAALEAGIKVQTSTVITKHNMDAVDWIVEFARTRGTLAEFNFLFHQSRGKTDSRRFMAETQAFKNTARHIADLKAAGAPILFSEQVYRVAENWPDPSRQIIRGNPPPFRHIPCNAGRFMMFIDTDGRVYPCVQLIDTFDAVNCREAGLQAAWKNCAGHDCRACYFPCFNELNQIMNLDMASITGQIKATLLRHFK